MEFILNKYCFKRTNLINYAIILDLSCGDASIALMKILFVNMVVLSTDISSLFLSGL